MHQSHTGGVVERAFHTLHDLSLDISGEITPDRIAGWAASALERVIPGQNCAVWWRDSDRAWLVAGEPPGVLAELPPKVPAHLCLVHHGKLIQPDFFGYSIDTGWSFVPITDRLTLYGWIGLPFAEPLDPHVLPFLCTVGAMLGQAIKRYRDEEERLSAERKQALLSRYLSPAMVQEITTGDLQERSVTDASVLLLDLRGFTERIYSQAHATLLGELNAFFDEAVRAVFAHHGVVDKLLGDGLLAEFGILPGEPPHAAQRAVNVAKALLEMTESFNRRFCPVTPFKINIGIATGAVHLGHLGGEGFFDLTVLGQAVNLASRLEGEAKTLGYDVAVDQATFDALIDQGGWHRLAGRSIRGIPHPVDVYAFRAKAAEPRWK